MSDPDDLGKFPQATVIPKKRLHPSAVWIIPIVVAVVALGIAIQKFMSEGPTVTILFKKAEGIEAGKTFVKHRDVNIGRVTKVKFTDDYKDVMVTAKIDKSAEGLIVDDAKFWVEQPRVTLSGISGISTLMSGNYIGMEVGKSKKIRHEFVGLDVPPTISVDESGRKFTLQAENLGSVEIGSPLYFRRINVGQVIGYDLAPDGRSVIIKAFVRAPYDKYVTAETMFWQASGIDVSLGTNGLTVQAQSVVSMLIGGIAFETPPAGTGIKPAAAETVFPLYGDRTTALTKHETAVTYYVLHFDESLRGLNPGAPVTYLGLTVGEVTKVGLEYDSVKGNIVPRVDIAVYPRRFLTYMKQPEDEPRRVHGTQERRGFLQRMIDKGLRAQLRSASIATGQMYVAFDRFRNAPRVKIDWTKTPVELPVMPGSLQDLENKISSILDKIDRMPLEAVVEDVRKTLAGLDKTVKDANRLMNRIESETVPEAKTTMESLRRTLANAEQVLASTDKMLVGKDAPAQQELRDALKEIARAAKGISMLTEYLERNPEALIRGKAQEKP